MTVEKDTTSEESTETSSEEGTTSKEGSSETSSEEEQRCRKRTRPIGQTSKKTDRKKEPKRLKTKRRERPLPGNFIKAIRRTAREAGRSLRKQVEMLKKEVVRARRGKEVLPAKKTSARR